MIATRIEAEIAILTLGFGRGNALDAGRLREIARCVGDCAVDPPRGLVITAEGSIFCAGLDLPALVRLDREGIADLLDALATACRALLVFPRPVVAAINGHAVAGGALLTLACDRRHMVEGGPRWGLTESSLGLALPAFAIEMARRVLERRAFEEIVYGGGLHDASAALALGAVDVIGPTEDLIAVALRSVELWTPSVEAFAEVKRRLLAPTVAAFDAALADADGWVEGWFEPPTRARVEAAVAALEARARSKERP